MDGQVKTYYEGVKKVLHRDYAGSRDCCNDWIEAVLKNKSLERLYLQGYTEEAAAQKIFEESFKIIKPDAKTNRLNSKDRKQEGGNVTGMKLFQVAVKADRQYSRLPTEIAKMLFQKILKVLKKSEK